MIYHQYTEGIYSQRSREYLIAREKSKRKNLRSKVLQDELEKERIDEMTRKIKQQNNKMKSPWKGKA